MWHDKPCRGLLEQSNLCIEAIPAQRVFSAYGEGICWAVLDSGIDQNHPHFHQHANILQEWKDFVGVPERGDLAGHGTAVAGIIAGEGMGDARELMEFGFGLPPVESLRQNCKLSGIAPKAKLYDIRVLDAQRTTPSSRLIQAMRYIRVEVNCRTHVIHGINISVGCRFDPSIYGAGHTPLCEEANRLAASGVVVCVAAGNDGYLPLEVSEGLSTTVIPKLVDMSINDPANADKVIAVGSCHKENPHTFGISYFSSKGPTSDGRPKPDLLGPGEKILTCLKNDNYSHGPIYGSATGTSFACPHVSGAIAAFLSVKREFIGMPDLVKKIFLESATDLGRDRNFQGYGLVNLLKALERV
jgi:subtilisin family serine protease